MPPPLHQRFSPGQPVEIYFTAADRWQPGVVDRFQRPGVWVRTADRQLWFVTNGRRIRPAGSQPEPADE